MAERRTRRECMGLATAGAVGAFAPSLRGASPSPFAATADRALDADLVVVNAKVCTMEIALPRTEAFGEQRAHRRDWRIDANAIGCRCRLQRRRF
jgi:hypothetical protein